MRKILSSLIISLLLFSSASAQSKPARPLGGDEQTIRKILEQQRQAWNKGEIETFMSAYWQSDSLMFIGKSGITYGWQKTLDNYKKGYPDIETMGILDFHLVEIKRLSVMYFFVVGKWHLTRGIGNVEGQFTLLFKKVKDKWVIVADHSS